jgi:hypothetical protein
VTAKAQPRFVVVGAFVADCLVRTDQLPEWDKAVRADSIRMSPGWRQRPQSRRRPRPPRRPGHRTRHHRQRRHRPRPTRNAARRERRHLGNGHATGGNGHLPRPLRQHRPQRHRLAPLRRAGAHARRHQGRRGDHDRSWGCWAGAADRTTQGPHHAISLPSAPTGRQELRRAIEADSALVAPRQRPVLGSWIRHGWKRRPEIQSASHLAKVNSETNSPS